MAKVPSLNQADYPPGYFEEYSGHHLITVAASFICAECCFVTLQFVARSYTKRGRGLNDGLVVLALIGNLTLCAISIAFVTHGGVGRHLAENVIEDPGRVTWWAKGLIALEWIYALAVMLPKLAILSFYLLIFDTRTFRMITYALGFVLVATFLSIGLVATLQCTPLAYDWDKTIPGGHCIDQIAFYRWISLPNIATDVIMLILPLPVIWSLNMSRNQKYGLSAIFVTGGLGLVASCIRFGIFFNSHAFNDPTWRFVTLIIWTIVEPGVYLIAACLPTLRPLLLHIFRRVATGSKLSGVSSNSTGKTAVRRSSRKAFGGEMNDGFRQLGTPATDGWIEDKSSTGTRIVAVSAFHNADAHEADSVPLGSISYRSDIHIARSPHDRAVEVV